MIYNCELDLPAPLSLTSKEKLIENKRNGVNTSEIKYMHVTDDASILSPEIIEKFQQLGLTPNVIFYFGFLDRVNFTHPNQLVHTDIVYHDNSWAIQPFAINWELADTEAEFRWWDVGDSFKAYPPLEIVESDISTKFARGIHYGGRMNFNIPPYYKILETYTLRSNQALAVNTSIPHSVIQKVNTQPRFGLSIRFPLSQILTWEHGVKLFGGPRG